MHMHIPIIFIATVISRAARVVRKGEGKGERGIGQS